MILICRPQPLALLGPVGKSTGRASEVSVVPGLKALNVSCPSNSLSALPRTVLGHARVYQAHTPRPVQTNEVTRSLNCAAQERDLEAVWYKPARSSAVASARQPRLAQKVPQLQFAPSDLHVLPIH